MFIFTMTFTQLNTSDPPGRSDSRSLDSLILSTAAGDQDSFSLLYEKTKNSVFGFALSFLKNPHDAEDIMHDAFIRIWSSADKYISSGKPMAWILTIVRNLCLMRLREGKKASGIAIDELSEYLTANSGTSTEDRELLVSAFRILSDEEIRIIMLHAVAGFKHREIAEVLKITQATVITKYRRSLKKLKLHIEEVEGR